MLNKQKDLTRQIDQAVTVLRDGGVIAFPTETVYGLGCDPRHPEAVQRIFQLKGRDSSKPLLLVAASMAQVKRVVIVPEKARQLAARYWPGPLTLILRHKTSTLLVPGVAVNGEVSIRISSSPIVRALTRQFGFPIVATSANLAGMKESRSHEEVFDYFGTHLKMIVQGGRLPLRKASTVLRVQKDSVCELIRDGAIRLPKKYFLAK